MNPEQIQTALACVTAESDPSIKHLQLASLVSAVFRERGIELVVVGGSAARAVALPAERARVAARRITPVERVKDRGSAIVVPFETGSSGPTWCPGGGGHRLAHP